MTHDDNNAEVQSTGASEESVDLQGDAGGTLEDAIERVGLSLPDEDPLPETVLAGEGSLSLSLTPWTDGAADETEADREDAVVSAAGIAPTTVTATRRRVLSGGWTMALVMSGIAIIAACVLIPQGDETRKLMYEREKLRADLEQVQKQVATNDEFLKKVQSDPTLAQRLAQRQMKLIPAGTKVLDLEDASPTKDDKSPFLIVSVPPPAPMAPYQPRGGWFSQMCRNGRSQLYMIGGGLMLVATGLVLGASGQRD